MAEQDLSPEERALDEDARAKERDRGLAALALRRAQARGTPPALSRHRNNPLLSGQGPQE